MKKNNKKIAPLVCALVFISIFLVYIFLFTSIASEIGLPILFLLVALFSIPIFGITYSLFERFKEIDGGEEDDASKY